MRSNSICQKLPFLSADLFYHFEHIVGDFLFPPKCLVCGEFFRPPENINAHRISFGESWHDVDLNCSGGFDASRFLGLFLCPGCVSGLTAIQPPICHCCGIMFKSREGDNHLCGDCIETVKKFNMARAPFIYDQIMLEVIHRYKYKGKIQLAGALGALLLTAFIKFWDNQQIDCIVPVPLHGKKFRQRGFNQSFLLIKDWMKLWPVLIDTMPSPEIVRDALKRIRPTAPQIGLGRADRLLNIKGAFVVESNESLENKRVLLVDDVYTTGATVNECARVLLDAGVRSVDILTLARAQ